MDIGDSVMAFFFNVETALQYLISLAQDTGSSKIKIRGAIDTGPITLRNGQFQGGPLFFVPRMLKSMGKLHDIWLSNRAYADLAENKEPLFTNLTWTGFKKKLATAPPYNGLLWKLDRESSDIPRFLDGCGK